MAKNNEPLTTEGRTSELACRHPDIGNHDQWLRWQAACGDAFLDLQALGVRTRLESELRNDSMMEVQFRLREAYVFFGAWSPNRLPF